jgi:hypothetical protein
MQYFTSRYIGCARQSLEVQMRDMNEYEQDDSMFL